MIHNYNDLSYIKHKVKYSCVTSELRLGSSMGCWLLVDRLFWPASGEQQERRGGVKTGKARTLDQKKNAAKCEAELIMVFDDNCRFLQCV